MKDATLIKLMSDETFENEVKHPKFKDNIKSNIEHYELHSEVDGFLTLFYQGERIDFPENWGVFKANIGSYVINISQDEILERVLNKFFKEDSTYSISKSSNGIYLIKTRRIQKKAA